MLGFSQWLDGTAASGFVRDVLWLIPTFQSIHIIALALLFSSVCALAAATYGGFGPNLSLAAAGRRFAPWIWTALGVLAFTGSVLTIGEPVRELINWSFWIKMPLILVAGILTAGVFSWLARTPEGPALRSSARRRSLVLVGLWVLVVVFGRLIAYGQIA